MNKVMRNEIHYIINAKTDKKGAECIRKSLSNYVSSSQITVINSNNELDQIFIRDNLISRDREHDQNKEMEKDISTVLGESFNTYVAVGDNSILAGLAERSIGLAGGKLAFLPIEFENKKVNKIKLEENIKKLEEGINKNNANEQDILIVNERVGLKTIGLGFEAQLIGYLGSQMKRRFGYAFALLKTIYNFRPFYVKIYDNIRSIEGVYWMVTFSPELKSNQKSIINRFKNLKVVLVKPYPPLKFSFFLFHLMTNRLKKSKYVNIMTFRGPVMIESTPVKAHIDDKPFKQNEIFKINLDQISFVY